MKPPPPLVSGPAGRGQVVLPGWRPWTPCRFMTTTMTPTMTMNPMIYAHMAVPPVVGTTTGAVTSG